MNKAGLYLGLISGTSMDAIDAVAARIDDDRPQLTAAHSHPWPAALRRRLLAAAQAPETLSLSALYEVQHQVTLLFATAARTLLSGARLEPAAVAAVGFHGQTLCHFPEAEPPWTLQLGEPAKLAVELGLPVVGDLRSADLAAGGQGAPLAPLLHRALFALPGRRRGVLNLGGIANLTVIDAAGATIGFDIGPANALLDAWCQKQTGEAFDRDGRLAAGGRVLPELLAALLAEPYFARPPPKSTGRETYHLGWLAQRGGDLERYSPADVQATLLALTIETTAAAARAAALDELLVCGGGVHNPLLMQALGARLAPRPVYSTARAGLDPDWVEGLLIAWLAWRRLARRPSSTPPITGAHAPQILGGLWYPPERAARGQPAAD